MRTARAERLLLALVLAFTQLPAAAVDLGTLFHTPEERERLDRLRRGEPDRGVRAPGAREVTGFVKRSDGRGTVWIDGVPMQIAVPKAERLLDPRAVRSYSERDGEPVRIERKPPK
ncbi:MAG TPA: hypothetical protein VM073_11865 [Usitatibacter sp.]|nr:hypothetical protein [Usitatibacter sp.]